MTWYTFARLFHIIAVILFIGGLFARQLVRSYAKKSDDIRMFATLNQAAGKIESILVRPGSILTLVFGVLLALIGGFPIFGFLQGASQNWLLVSNLLLIGSIVIVPTIFLPRGRKFEPLLQAALSKGEITAELRAAMDDGVVKTAHIYEEVSVIVVVILMVLKPF
jgi:uncharacterized membrane protein